MSNQPIINTQTSHNAGVPPAPSEARQQASQKIQTQKSVCLNGSKIDMALVDGQWINFKVTSL